MSISWWRSWHGAPTDHKWAVIAAKSGTKTGIVSAVAWALFDYASQTKDRGSIIGFDTETYAVYSGFPQEQIEAIMQAMTDKGIIQDGRLVNWEKRQPKREDNSNERVRKFRAMKRSVTQGNANDVVGNAPEEEEDKESDKDKESEEEEYSAATVFQAYEGNIGALTQMIAEQIGDDLDEYGPLWCYKAIEKATMMEKRSWAYCRGILKGWHRDGFNVNGKAEAKQERFIEHQ